MYDALIAVGHYAHVQRGTIGVEVIMEELNAGRPVVAQIEWWGGGDHNAVIAGCNDDGMLSIQDPQFGSSRISIADFSVRYLGFGTWTETFFTR